MPGSFRRYVCLIIAPSVFLLDERVFLSLGILRVAASLEQAGIAVEMVDLSGIENFEDAISAHASASAARVFGITATSPQMPAAMKVAAAIRTHRPEARIILGGPHITLVHAAAKRERRLGINGRATQALNALRHAFDVLVAGDGEDAALLAIAPHAPGLIDADDPASPLFLTDQRLNAMPLPARHLVDIDSYHYTIGGERSTSIIGQLGCPYACRFCGGRSSPMLRRIRARTTDSILAELRHLHEQYGYRGIMFYDDELNVSPQMVPLMDAITALGQQLGFQFKLRGFIKSQLFTAEQANAMRRAGFEWILVGFESGSAEILGNINKKATLAENTRCVEIARQHGLKVKALMSLGHAGETPDTIQETKDWLLRMRPDDFDATVITTYPGTPYYDLAVETSPGVWTFTCPENGARLHSDNIDFGEQAGYYKGKPGEYQAFVFTDALSAAQLAAMRDDLETTVRHALQIPFNPTGTTTRFDHSMGQSGGLPSSILRHTQ